MFPRKNRFSFKNKLPKNVLNSPSFTLRYENNDEELKAAVVVSKKVEKLSTGRNKIKRKLRKLIAELFSDEKVNLVMFVKSAAKLESEIEKELEEAIKKIRNV